MIPDGGTTPQRVIHTTSSGYSKKPKPLRTLCKVVERVVTRPLFFPGSIRKNNISDFKLVAEHAGGTPLCIQSPISAGSNRHIVLRGMNFDPTAVRNVTLSPVAQNIWDWCLHYLSNVVKELGPLSRFSPPKGEVHVALLFSGNGGFSYDKIFEATTYLSAGFHVQLVDWRGYGQSEGSPSPEGILLDVEQMVDQAIRAHSQSGKKVKLLFHGHSMGTTAAIHGALYALHKHGPGAVSGILLDRPFSKIGVAAQTLTKGMGGIRSLAQTFARLDNRKGIQALALHDVRIGIVRGTQDKMMNPKGVTNSSPHPKLDRNAESLFQLVRAVRPDAVRSEYIADVSFDHTQTWWGQSESAMRLWAGVVSGKKPFSS